MAPSPAAAEVVLAPFGVTLRTPFGYEFSLAIIDICSTLETWPKGEERGVKFMLPCGKFADYADQFEGLLELLEAKQSASGAKERAAFLETETARLEEEVKKAKEEVLALSQAKARAETLARQQAERLEELCSWAVRELQPQKQSFEDADYALRHVLYDAYLENADATLTLPTGDVDSFRVPVCAGAILTVVLLTDNNVRSIGEQVTTTAILALCLCLLFVAYALAGTLFRLLGKSGIEIVSRVFGLILSSIAVTGLIVAIKLSFGLT